MVISMKRNSESIFKYSRPQRVQHRSQHFAQLMELYIRVSLHTWCKGYWCLKQNKKRKYVHNNPELKVQIILLLSQH